MHDDSERGPSPLIDPVALIRTLFHPAAISAQPDKPSYRPRKPKRAPIAPKVYGRRLAGVDPRTGEQLWEPTSTW